MIDRSGRAFGIVDAQSGSQTEDAQELSHTHQLGGVGWQKITTSSANREILDEAWRVVSRFIMLEWTAC